MPTDVKPAPIWVAAGASKQFPGTRRMQLDNLTAEDQEVIVAFLQALQNGRNQPKK